MVEETMMATLQSILCNVPQADGSVKKTPLDGGVRIHTHGLEAQDGTREHYADPDYALMHYALEHYDFWRTYYPARAALFERPGIFGENFSTRGMTEETVCIGDIIRTGTALLQISLGREACGTMAARLDDEQAPEIMHRQSRNGWFYRVLQTGETRCGEPLVLIERPYADWPLSRVQAIIFAERASPRDLEALSNLEALAEPWRQIARERLG